MTSSDCVLADDCAAASKDDAGHRAHGYSDACRPGRHHKRDGAGRTGAKHLANGSHSRIDCRYRTDLRVRSERGSRG